MQIIPAIDIQNGRCVRLLRGEFDAVTVYTDDLTGLAKRYADAGCSLLHVVDLDGAEQGNAANRRELEAIAGGTPMAIQTGGGIR
ncbi:MAG: HisA/HisF-related TIM barrel protein, partial [Pseudomonadota bacterium]